MKKKELALVLFSEKLPRRPKSWWQSFRVVIAPKGLESQIEGKGIKFFYLEEFVEPGSIYEASAFAEELSLLDLLDGTRLTKSFLYGGYELWWIHYDSLFQYFCLPYTQYKKLLKYLKNFQSIYFYRPPYKSLFFCYLQTYGCGTKIIHDRRLKSPASFPFGVSLQILITIFSLPFLIIKKSPVMVFTGDKFEKNKDFDFRMRFIYEELCQRNIAFVEFIRSLESWKAVLQHAFVRWRPVIYPEGITFVGRFVSFLSGGRRRTEKKFGPHIFDTEIDLDRRFKLIVATQYLRTVYDDVWAIRITKWVLHVIGVRSVFIAAAVERNFHAVLGCKLNKIPMVGILHGVASRYYNVYEFTPGFDGKKSLSVDRYGVWSEWWREYFIQNSKAYVAEQLFVSGPMRPLSEDEHHKVVSRRSSGDIINVLFVSEEVAVPREVLPYLNNLLGQKNINLTLKFRPYRDGFENWLLKNEPNLLRCDSLKVVKGNMQEAIKDCDVVVGSYSTAVLEAVTQLKVPIFFNTQKWGDYYSLKDYDDSHSFFAESPQDLVGKINNSWSIQSGTLKDLQKRYFGDPYKNGSKWVVDELEKNIK
jgi:hypothetical protein